MSALQATSLAIFNSFNVTASTRKPKHRSGFAISACLHCAVIGVLALQTPQPPVPEHESIYHYSVQIVRLQIPRYAPQLPPPQKIAVVPARNRPAAQPSPKSAPALVAPAVGAPDSAADQKPLKTFQMPAVSLAEPVRQTLVRPEVPPSIKLQRDIPMPELLLAFNQKLPAYPIKRFVAPAVSKVQAKTARVTLAFAPEIAAAGAPIASTPFTDDPHLPTPAAPVRAPFQVPHLVLPRATAHNGYVSRTDLPPVSVISANDNPALPTEVLVLPAVNQLGSGGLGGGNQVGRSGENGRATGQSGSAGQGSGGNGHSGTGRGAGTGTEFLASAGTGNANGIGRSSNGSASSIAGTGTGVDAPLNTGLEPGMKEFTFPKDGKFNVVVLGSTSAAPYPESSDALSGKVVYTVYLRVGQRRNWILQYCLPKSAVTTPGAQGTRTPLEAPWPYLVVRPEHPSDSNYVLVHGTISADGSFEQLAMVYPSELENKDLLLRSLDKWAFRPAKRDGVPTPVEMLLIIPREER